jgi:hypothetical protein
MPEYQESRLWKESLGYNNQDETSDFRDGLRKEYNDFRKHAKYLAGEIARSLPDFTIHDISHSDSLWHLASLVSGSKFKINPMEAFVLGGSFLIHDLGMGLVAYPEGIDQLKKESSWNDTIACLLKEKLDRTPTGEEIDNPDNEIVRQATEELLRGLHAKRAEQLCDKSWKDESNEYYLIENAELRRKYGPVIGKIAQSHWLPVSSLTKKFPSDIGALPGYPSDWAIDPIKLACLLRAADAVHIDASRAPPFLRILRKPSEISRDHWVFQGHLQQPLVENNRLKFTSGDQFPVEEASAWWLCFDVLKMIDRELCQIDALLADIGRERLEVRGVAGIEDANRLAELVPTKDWIPIDAQIKITNLPSLIKKLGGEHLYGKKPVIPLRELIQNGCDAIRARRIIESRSIDWGDIYVRIGKDSEGDWLEVEDSGIGMSKEVLTGPFLDFGKSYWGSTLMINEFSGLISNGYQSTGMFGIGFFSTFMIGKHIKVVTRRFDAALYDTLVLEFYEGLDSRPILRKADSSELLREGGTQVRVWLETPPTSKNGLLFYSKSDWRSEDRDRKCSLEDLCSWLCPSIDANLYIQVGEKTAKLIIKSQDWITINGKKMFDRIKHNATFPSKRNTKIKRHMENNLRLAYNRDGKPVMHACIDVFHISGTITVGGLHSIRHGDICGIIIGSTAKIARDSATPIIEKDILASWASEQADLIYGSVNYPWTQNNCARIILNCRGNIKNLPIGYNKDGWVNHKDIIEDYKLSEEVKILSESEFYPTKNALEKSGINIQLIDNVLVINQPNRRDVPIKDSNWGFSFLTITIEALAEAWSSPVEDILNASDFSTHEDTCRTSNGDILSHEVYVIRNPDYT